MTDCNFNFHSKQNIATKNCAICGILKQLNILMQHKMNENKCNLIFKIPHYQHEVGPKHFKVHFLRNKI